MAFRSLQLFVEPDLEIPPVEEIGDRIHGGGVRVGIRRAHRPLARERERRGGGEHAERGGVAGGEDAVVPFVRDAEHAQCFPRREDRHGDERVGAIAWPVHAHGRVDAGFAKRTARLQHRADHADARLDLHVLDEHARVAKGGDDGRPLLAGGQ